MQRLSLIVDKTAGLPEEAAFGQTCRLFVQKRRQGRNGHFGISIFFFL
jgi:hypothetical protein